MDKMGKRYLTQKEAEYYTGMGKTTLWSLMKGAVIQPTYAGRKFYDKNDIDRRIEAMKGKVE